MPRRQIEVPSLSAELGGADLGDARLNRRLGLLADRLAERPDASFPKALDDAELEAAYRFFGNDSVSPEAILAPHFRQSARRAAERKRVLIVHDTTQFEFPGHSKREGLGRLIRPGQGFFGHFSLATTADGTLTVGVDGKAVYTKTPSAAVAAKTFYFKAGNYDQTTAAGSVSTTPYTIVEVDALDVTHR
jgi:transposase-like protein